MHEPFDVPAFLARHSERRIRITDMIGRRGRFITLALAGSTISTRSRDGADADFATMFLQDNLFDAVLTSWIFLGFYYSNGFLARGVLRPAVARHGRRARAGELPAHHHAVDGLQVRHGPDRRPARGGLPAGGVRRRVRVHLGLVHGRPTRCAEIVGSLFGKQKIRVWGIGDVNRKSIAGTWRASSAR